MYTKPNKEQIAALAAFAYASGRNWKSNLRACWECGDYRPFVDAGTASQLQILRNINGPKWLKNYRQQFATG